MEKPLGVPVKLEPTLATPRRDGTSLDTAVKTGGTARTLWQKPNAAATSRAIDAWRQMFSDAATPTPHGRKKKPLNPMIMSLWVVLWDTCTIYTLSLKTAMA